jgi:hypothetical protein
MGEGGQFPDPFGPGSGGGGSGFNYGGAASGIGGIASGLWDMFGAQNPADAASPYYDKIPGMLGSTYQPYMQAGMNALNGLGQYENRGNAAGNALMGQYGQLVNDPDGFMNKLGGGFKQSPGYAFQTSQALGAANRAAAAGGMAGSPMEQQQIAGVTNQLANQDYYNYLNHAQSMYGMGLQGLQGTERLGANIGQGIYNTGANMADQYGQNMGAAYMNQGNMAYRGADNQNQMMGGGLGQVMGGLGDLGAMAFGF